MTFVVSPTGQPEIDQAVLSDKTLLSNELVARSATSMCWLNLSVACTEKRVVVKTIALLLAVPSDLAADS